MNYTDTAQTICSKIVETYDNATDQRMQNAPFGLDIYLDGNTYEAVVANIDEAHGCIAVSIEDNGHIEEVQLESLIFPCNDFNIINGIAVFDCIDPVDVASTKCQTLASIASKIASAGVGNISKVVVRLSTSGKLQTANVKDVQYCNIALQPMYNGKLGLALYCIELDKMLDLDYTSIIKKIAEQKFNEEMNFSESMKKLSKRFYEDDERFHEYAISFLVKDYNAAKRMNVKASTIEDAIKSFNERAANELHGMQVTKVTNITCDGKMVSKSLLDKVNNSMLDECDGAACGDAGGAAAPAASGDAGDTTAEMAGTTTADVLGTCKPGEGYMGKDNFYIPAKAKVPLHRWEAANGGSKRKKKGKYPYEKNMKVVVSMFEDDESALNTAYVWFEGSSKPEAFRHVSCMEQFLDLLDDIAYQANAVDGDLPSVMKCKINGRTYSQREIEKFIKQREDEQCSAFYEDDSMLNEFEDKYNSYEYLSGMTWEEVVDAARERASKSGKPLKLPEYERWEAAQLPAPEESEHGPLGGCTIDEDQYKRQYLKEFYIHGIYQDGEMFELGPMKRKVASEYLNMHELTVNKKAFQQMADNNFKGLKTIGNYNKNRPLHIGKLKDGFWLIDAQSIFKVGPFSNKQLARMYALKNNLQMEKGAKEDKAEEGYRLEYPTFAFSYKMAGIPCMDIVVAEDLERAMKRFDTQWRMFDNSRSTRDRFRTLQDLQRDLSLLLIKDIEVEELTPDNVDEYVELAKITGNPSTIPELQHRCRNPKFRYILGNEGKTGRLVIEPFSESMN